MTCQFLFRTGSVNARCDCPKGLGLTGPRCQKLDVNFNSRNGYVMTESLGSCSDLHISFEFYSTATPSNEVLLYDGPFVDGASGDYILVGLKGAKPYVGALFILILCVIFLIVFLIPQVEFVSKKGATAKSAEINFQVKKDKWYRLDIFYKHNGQDNDYMEIMIDRCRNGIDIAALDGVKNLNRDGCASRVSIFCCLTKATYESDKNISDN